MEKVTQEVKELMYGNIRHVELPSGYWAKIREQTGEDDDLISNPVLARDMSNISLLLVSLVIETNLPMAVGGKLTLEGVDKMLVNDQAIILIESRINSLGKELKFSWDWGTKGGQYDYIEDLENYTWKYLSSEKPFPYLPTDEGYNKYRCQPYEANAYSEKEFILHTGKKVKMKHMDILSQKELIQLTPEQNTKNSAFLIRNLQLEQGGEWVKVQNFKFFTSREMSELRNILAQMDTPFTGTTELKHPATEEVIKYNFMANNNFFFPGEMEN